jgi:hypothetical protein
MSARKARIGAIIDRIEVDQGSIRIMGRKSVLEQVVGGDGAIAPICSHICSELAPRRGFEPLLPT